MQEPLAKPTFAEVARIISKGKPPDWLVTGLERFSGGIGVETDRDLLRHLEQLRGATNVLMKLLPAFQHMPFNIKSCGCYSTGASTSQEGFRAYQT